MLVVPIVIFYVLVFRPQIKERKTHLEMIKNLKKHDEVVTTGGLFGVVVNTKSDAITLRIDENVRVDVEPSAIARKVQRPGATPAEKRG
jgi:preprotein translocase subunit YajC